MLADSDVWYQLIDPHEQNILCAECMVVRAAERLGRPLRLSDLHPCPFNISGGWFKMFLEKEKCAPGDVENLEEWLALDATIAKLSSTTTRDQNKNTGVTNIRARLHKHAAKSLKAKGR
jgi:hypothetical protein